MVLLSLPKNLSNYLTRPSNVILVGNGLYPFTSRPLFDLEDDGIDAGAVLLSLLSLPLCPFSCSPPLTPLSALLRFAVLS